jgi:diguanylate cyclase (GGDEF)-like protein/PAS domain S-box-containing protein
VDAQHILVITTNTDRFEALRNQLYSWLAPTDRLDLALEHSVVGAESYVSREQVDLVVLDIDQSMARDPSSIHSVIRLFAPVPVVAWLDEQDSGLSRELVGHGAVACLEDSMIGSSFLPQTFDIIARGAKALQLRDERFAQMSVTLEAIADAVICTDSRADITFTNSAARRLLNFPPDELVGCAVAAVMTLQDHHNRKPITHPVHQAISSMRISRLAPGTILVRHDQSEIRIADCCSPIIDSSGALQGTVMVFHDITEAYEMRAHIDHLASHDFLTNLPNRFAIQRRLDDTLAHAAIHHQSVPLMYLDLDKFKLVNDTLGHGAGDKLLVSVANRLCACFRLADMVGRQGGDEFIVVMAPGSRREDAMLASARILETLGKPHTINGSEVRTGCSIGIAMFPEHANTAETLMLNADVALQSVKTAGRNGSRMFSPDLMAEKLERQLMEKALRHAVEEDSFSLVYQPKVSLGDDTVVGCEALLRWHHPDWGWVPPTKFIPCAEACGLIDVLGKWVLAQAMSQAHAWQKAEINFGHIAINISAQELRHPAFVDHIRTELKAFDVDPDTLQLELTESVLMHDVDYAGKVLGELKGLGLSVAIDDFGTGYSSLSYLNDLQVDVLKIDRSFIHGIHRADTRQQALLHAILSLAASLSLRVVVEGIETVEEKYYLHKNGCEIGQGYYFSEPLEASHFEKFIEFRDAADKLMQ